MNKPRDVQVYPIAANTTVLRSRTWDRLKFEIEYALQRGTTANSYLIQADKVALIDPPGESFTDIFLTELQGRIDPKEIDYVILGHVNPNRGVTIKALLELAPQLQFVCSNPGAIALRSILELPDLNVTVARGDESLDLGKGHVLEFIPTPNPRWPDSLCSGDRNTGILFTDKFFGVHVCGDQVLDEGWVSLNEDRRYYFDCVMAPHATQVEKALDKLAGFEARLYATGHGQLVRYSLMPLTRSYRQWCEDQRSQDLSVALLYASAYGNTGTVASAIARGITKAGVAVESINCEVTSPEEIRAVVEKADGFIMGSPTLGGHAPTPIQTALGIVLSTATKTKLAGVFGSFGWSGEAIDLIEGKFRDAGFQFGFDTIRVKFKPTDAILKLCEEAGTDFAQALRKVKKSRTARQSSITSQVDRTEQAVGRLIGSLCIVTAQKGEVSGAMLADWIAQATFNPPGLTVAVAKDRAMESLLYQGDKFVVNILEEGKHLPLMKHFLKPFAPGEDRFAGVATDTANNGCPILTDSLSYLECTVENRMECGDHWLVYGVVSNGKLLKSDGLTAVHHRKSGNHY
ncbi:MAG TPA: flavin oxidoreductase [Cyanobacteria bacterium UBA11149]|nr:flavin oxidoreductase [Cyanobacteria bacterium UBA11367]HBE58911.1 flavin oxidoreductase [Cyanobacteria bacterium UBA11366]HBK66778.1 flavin oxidoreductase [Cyanobacteria bacterium UBA11166]HBR72206.1 flavin oxidoreductase [Cyanobacteria bacterium UBA11159]HBS69669.1 flavin oxidoreductase [Cyanobacteria bacterium UBA11153]HBW88221.1 flavin oxidoreductase [Cyanobacteria bacterium UBA11149]HCA95579.1 flavin oxidoreductase [Cyanobacteria bacterium UBA9226]